MKTTDRRDELERMIERRNDLEAYVHLLEKDGDENHQLRGAREELAALRELCRELMASAPTSD